MKPIVLGLSADEVLTTTRAVRKRLDLTRSVPRALVQECVQIATQAPTGSNRQHWDFVFVDDPGTRLALAEVWRAGLVTGDPDAASDQVAYRKTGEWLGHRRMMNSLEHLTNHLHEVPVLMIPTVRVASRSELRGVRGQAGNWGSVMPAIWSFMLAARERGLGTAWTTAHLTYEREVAELLGIPFDTVVQAALIPIAFTIGADFCPGPRANAREFAHWNGWSGTSQAADE